MHMKDIQILLTNDDGIRSPGLWAAASALSEIGFVHVAAPREQYSGAGRSMPSTSDGIIQEHIIQVNGQNWKVYSVGGTPAQTVLHAVLEILPRCPDLVVSGINYGENLGTGVTISGTVGAALEGAALGIPSLAISLETEPQYHLSYATHIDFRVAAHFAQYFSRLLLSCTLPFDVDVLKVDVPASATVDTPWEMCRLSRKKYYEPLRPKRRSWSQPGRLEYRLARDAGEPVEGTDAYVMRVKRWVAVTPLSLDMTSRVDMAQVEQCLRSAISASAAP
jgi:5'-nucleotidase